MRLVQQIPHPHYLIQLHQYNNKYILSISLDEYEQSYKVPTELIADLQQLTQLIDEKFLTECLHQFMGMRTRWTHLLNTLQS